MNYKVEENIIPSWVISYLQQYTEEAIRNTTPNTCLLYTSPSPRDRTRSRMPSSA